MCLRICAPYLSMNVTTYIYCFFCNPRNLYLASFDGEFDSLSIPENNFYLAKNNSKRTTASVQKLGGLHVLIIAIIKESELTRPWLPSISESLAVSSDKLTTIFAATSATTATRFRLVEMTIDMPLQSRLKNESCDRLV